MVRKCLILIFFLFFFLVKSGFCQTVSLTLDTAVAGSSIPDNFVGFSFNPAYSTQYFGTSYNGNNDRVISKQLFQNFTPYQKPGIRIIGANNSYWKGTGSFSSQPTAWNNTLSFNCTFCPSVGSPSFSTTIDSNNLNDMKGFIESLNYNPQVLFGVNSAIIDSARTRDFGLNIKNKLAVINDLQFEIGNEPDAFISNARRLNGYNIVPFVKEFNLLAKGLFSFGYAAAPAFAKTNNTSSTSWSDSIFYLIDSSQGRIKTVTYHDYPLGLSSNPTTVNTYLNKFLSNQYSYDAVANISTGLAPSINTTNGRGLKLRMAEVNSVAGGGVDLVSNSFGAALWGIDYMFELVRSGCVGINFATEGGSTVYYSPFTYSSTFTGSGKVGIRPLYYGMLLFAKTAQGNAKLIKQTFTSAIDSNQIKVWSVKDTTGVVRIMIINRGTSITDVTSATIRLTLPGRTTNAKVYLLKATSSNGLQDTTGVTIAGQSISNVTGVLVNSETTSTVIPSSSVYTITVKAATAVMVEIPPNPCIALSPSTTATARCGTGIITVSATPATGETIDWYSTLTGGTLLQSGSSSYTTSIALTSTFYAVSRSIAGGCTSSPRIPVTATLNPISTIDLTSLPDNSSQTITIGNAISSISYAVGGGASGAIVSGLPGMVNGNYSAGTLTISGTPNQLGTFNYTVTTTGSNCTEVIANGSITVNELSQATADYFSNANGNFTAANSWEYFNGIGNVSATAPPTGNCNITVRNGHQIVLDANYTCGAGKTFLLSSGSLIVNPNITIDVSASGTINLNGQAVTIKSTTSGTGSVGKIQGSLLGASNVTVERYLPSLITRRWRLLSIPTLTTQSINTSWQNSQLPRIVGVNNVGTWITANLPNSVALGYDTVTQGNSMLVHNPTTMMWDGITSNTTTTAISTDRGYMIYIRGDRNATPTNAVATNTTLSTTGSLKVGNYPSSPLSIPANKNAAIGNPYASAIDLRNVSLGTNTDRVFYLWDPRISGSYGVGAFQTLTWTGNNYIITPGGGSYGGGGSVMNTIQSGQAFLAHATGGNGSIQFNENCKVAGSVNVSRNNSLSHYLITNLYSIENGLENLADGNMVLFDSAHSDVVNGSDAHKVNNFGENLGMVKDGALLTVEQRKPLNTADTIFYKMTNLKPNHSYTLSIETKDLNRPGLACRLEDKITGSSLTIDLNGSTSYSFGITSDTATSSADRFKLIFSQGSILPVQFLSLTANQQRNSNILVEWKVANQQNIHHYDVERSADGRAFSKVGTQAPTGLITSERWYSWQDIQPIKVDSYYRIKSTDQLGEQKISKVVKINVINSKPGIRVYPNPVKNRKLYIELEDMPKGEYHCLFINNLGQVAMKKKFFYAGGNGIQMISLEKELCNEQRKLIIIKPDNGNFEVGLILKIN